MQTAWLPSIPHTTCPLAKYPYFGAAKCLPQCCIPEQCFEDCQQIVHVGSQFTIALCILLVLVATAAALAILCRHLQVRAPDEAGEAHVSSRTRALHKMATVASAPLEDRERPSDLAPADTSGASASERGKNKIIGGIALGSSSNATQAQAQSASTQVDVIPLAIYESRLDGINEMLDDGIHTQETTQGAPGSRRGASNPLHQSSPPVTDGNRLGFFQASFYRSLTYLVDQFTAITVQYRLIPRFSNRPLLHSLHGYDPALPILAIAGDDAERDLTALHHAFMNCHAGSVRFASFSRDVTLVNIEAEIKKLCDECGKIPDTHLFIYLTGHGNRLNKMVTPQSGTISETYLFKLLSAHGPPIPVTILFDICRQARIPSAVPPKDISLVWTCSLGETAGACRVPDCDGPNSCFLNALMMSARTPNLEYTSEMLKRTVQEWLHCLMDYLKAVYVMKHPTERCTKCSDKPEPCDKPERQNIDWGDAKDMGGLLELTKILSSSEIAEEVYQWFMNDVIFLKVVSTVQNNLSNPRRLGSVDHESKPGLPLAIVSMSSPASVLSHLPDDNVGGHGRGANEPVHAGKI